MNKAFKVLWNDVRRSYVVSSEAQMSHGKPARSSKTLVAAAVAGVLALGASSAFAALPDPITNDSFGTDLDTTKFHSGNGYVNIQTEGDARKLLKALLSKNLGEIQGALGFDGQYATLVGTAGGKNYFDKESKGVITLAGHLGGIEELKRISSILNKQFEDYSDTGVYDLTGDTSVVIGGTSKNPLVVATVGADRAVNAFLSMDPSSTGNKVATIVRKGSTSIEMNSGNSLLMTGASAAINVGEFVTLKKGGIPFVGTVNVTPSAKETHVKLEGNSKVMLNGSSSTALTIVGGSSVSLAGKSTSTVTGNTYLSINTASKGLGFEGLTIGAIGGGTAVSLFGGQSRAEVLGDTTIDVKSGLSVGLLGGGVALAGHVSYDKAQSLIPNGKDAEGNKDPSIPDFTNNIILNEAAFKGGEKADVTSKNINIHLGKDSSTALVVGGGLAAAYQYDSASQGVNATATTSNVNITIGEKDAAPVFASVEEKSKYFVGIKAGLQALKDVKVDNITDKEKDVVALIDTIASEPGVNVGVMGGGIAASWSRNEHYTPEDAKSAPKALATVGDVVMDVFSGYNVGLVGGGLAAASGDATVPKDQTKPSATLAESTADSVTMNFVGGETIGVMGGGIAVAAGTGDMNYGVGAVSHVGTVNLNVAGGSVDGLIGGGYAIDDTNPVENKQPQASKTASSTVDTVNITATSGQIGRLAFDAFFGQNQLPPLEKTQPGDRDYLDSMTYAMIEGKAAVIGGGMAAGLRDDKQEQGGAHVKNVNIVIAGDTVVGEKDNVGYRANIYGGGLATEGALSTVDKAYIQIGDASGQGPVINGDIYGGGIALDGMYMNAPYYNNAQSKVGSAEIVIASGTVNGDIYAGGRVISADNDKNLIKDEASSIVETAHVKLLKNGVFKGEKIDATGVTGDATLTMANEVIDLGKATVTGFNKVVATNHAKNFTFDFGEKKATTFEGVFDVNGFAAKEGSTLTLVGDSVLATKDAVANVAFKVDNGVLALGDKADAMTAHEQLASVNAIPGLYLAGAVDLTKANATIGKVAEGATGVVIGANGSLMADAAADTKVTGTITGTKDSGIYFTNVAEKDAKVVFEDGALKDFDLANGITVDNIRYDVINDKNTFTFEVITNQAQLYSLGLDGFDGEALNLIEKQDDAASKHIQSLMDQQNTAVKSGEHRHAQLNAAFNVATAAGVQTAGIEGAMLGLDQAAKRASLTNTFADGWTGFAEVTGTQVEMGGSRDMLESKTKLGGLAAGGEYTTGDWTFGALMNLGAGEVKGQGHNAGVKNDVDFYGVQGYAAKRLGQFNVVGQAGWVMTKNDIKHAMGDSADVDANVYTVGARGEMQMALTDSVAMVPYVGVNYLRVETDGYTTKKGFKVDDVTQDLVNVPVGVAVKGDFGDMAGWQMKPVADIAYVHTFGDTNVEAQTGVGAATMATNMDVWSENVGRVRFGLEAQKDNMSFGFTLGGAAGSDDHREVYGQINAKYVF